MNSTFASGTAMVRSPPVWPRTVRTTTLRDAQPDDEILVGGQVGQRDGGDPRLELRRDAVTEQIDVVGPHPAADVAVGDNDGSGIAQRLVAAGVIEVVMRVDDVADRFGRQPVDLGDEGFGRIEIEEAVDHEHSIVADDEAGVGAGLVFRSVDRGVNAWADLLQHERQGLGRRGTT